MKFSLTTTIQFILISFAILLTACTKNKDEKIHPEDQKIIDFLAAHDRFEADEHQKQLADSIGKHLVERKNNKSNRELLRKYIIRTFPGKDDYYYYILKQKAEKSGDLVHLGNAHELLAKYYDITTIREKDSTLINSTKAEMYYRQSNDTLNLLGVLIFKSITLLNDDLNSEAQTSLLEALSYNGLNHNIKTKFTLNLMLGNALTGLGQYQEAKSKIQQALVDIDSKEMEAFHPEKLRTALRITAKLALIRNYTLLKEYDLAKKTALETIEKDVDFTDVAYGIQINYASLLQLLSEAKILSNDFDGVEQDLNTAIKSFEDANFPDYSDQTKTILADYYFRVNNPTQALSILEEVVENSRKNKFLSQEKDALFLLLSKTNIPSNDHFLRYLEVSNLINDHATNISNTFARIRFESDQLVVKNEELEAQKKIILNTAVASILLILLGFMTYFFRQKSKQLRIVKLLQKDTEKYYNSILAMKQELALAQSVERKKLSQDLHDGVLNKVFVTRFLLMQLTKEDLDSKRDIIVDEITNIEKFLRDASHLLSNENEFKTNSFDTLLQELVDLQNRTENIDFTLSIDPTIDLEELGTKTKIHLYRILQETLQNAQKYSNAKNCWITFKSIDENNIELNVQDNGVGFNVKDNFKGIGLNNIKERARIIKAKLSIASQPNKGTIITLVFKKSIKE
ncbi:ATP-binding protein [Myroides sp. LJL116]